MIGGDSSSGAGKVKTTFLASSGAVIVVIFSSIFTRLCACTAFDALALKRSTKDCRCARRASCFLASACNTARRSATCRANWSYGPDQ